jgi:hypothetical protein
MEKKNTENITGNLQCIRAEADSLVKGQAGSGYGVGQERDSGVPLGCVARGQTGRWVSLSEKGVDKGSFHDLSPLLPKHPLEQSVSPPIGQLTKSISSPSCPHICL